MMKLTAIGLFLIFAFVGACAQDDDPLGLVEQGVCTEYGCDSFGNCSYFPSGCDNGAGGGGGGTGGGGGGGGGTPQCLGVITQDYSCDSWQCVPTYFECQDSRWNHPVFAMVNQGLKARHCYYTQKCNGVPIDFQSYTQNEWDFTGCWEDPYLACGDPPP